MNADLKIVFNLRLSASALGVGVARALACSIGFSRCPAGSDKNEDAG
jgi:hypothetical protein